ncbi:MULTISPECIES: EAL domain-containing protein [Enterobacteriaceae]|uniref:EAL domain-containing protein n=1 Tax=Enterobacteriaceae TaxID=543 RepID=UPI000272B365|nr:EAL domain-containing protein [Enterobacter sp. Ag1]EJF29775.1 EAL domain-containing protein [Enterobacter sp. Ag1]
MTSQKRVTLVNGVLIVAVLLPILLSIYLAHNKAEKNFHNELENYADRGMVRSDKVISQANMALRQINAFRGQHCSASHLDAMRRVAFDYLYIQEVVYLVGDRAVCSSLEAAHHGIKLGPPDTQSTRGFFAWYTDVTDLGFQRPMIYIGNQDHVVVIDPQAFIDVIPLGNTPVNVALVGLARNRLIASNTGLPNNSWESQVAKGVTTYSDGKNDYVILRSPASGLALITWASSAPLQTAWYKQLVIWLPIGILVSLSAGWFITRLLRRLESPQARIQDAIRGREFSLEYQPIVDLKTGEGVGAEALLRWRLPDGSFISPDIFIPIAEQTGLISQITELVIKKTFADLGDWLHAHPRHHISINLSPSDVLNDRVLLAIRPLLLKYQVKAEQIALEITERGFADPKVSAPIVAKYREAGHPIYLDDFGTGYSSLSYLQDLDVDILKIDKSFVDALEYKNVTPYIIEMAKTLHLATLAEGIETAAQAAWLREHGVAWGQGWLYSKALPKQAFIDWIARNRIVN